MTKYQITTPEQVHFHYETAGLASRCMAWLADQALLMVLRAAVVWCLARLIAQEDKTLSGMAVALMILLFFALDFGYFVLCELRWAGQSPGKRMLGLRVISARGGRLCFADVLIRNLLRPLDTLPFAMLTGGIVAFLDPFGRRLGDLAAETLVVKDAHLAIPKAILAQQARHNTFRDDTIIRNRILSRVTREERDLVLDLMLRRDGLDPTIREELFAQAAGLLREHYALPDNLEHLSDEQIVLNVALVIQDMHVTA